MKYRIEYSPETEKHLRILTKHQQTFILDAVERQLQHQPNVETKDRKPMRPNPIAPWELRIGNTRVFYDLENKLEPVVYVRAIVIKKGNKLRIGLKEIEL